MAWAGLVGLLAVLALITGYRLRRGYQRFRIRQHKFRVAWREYRQSRQGPRWW